jgi:3-dehydroquinate dehydratase
LKQRLLAKEHHMIIFVNSENYFMINMEIIRSQIYTRVDMRGTNHEIKIDNLLRHETTKDNSIIIEPNGYTV